MAGPVVAADDVKSICQKEGFLAKQVYVVFTTPTGGMEPVMASLNKHLAVQVELEAQGIMVAAGPHWTDGEQEWKGEGMVVIRAGSLAEAKEIAARDPMHKSGARKFVVRPWFVNEGTITVRLNFSKKSFEMV
jgi:uncharacterized protein YciI